MPRWNNSLSDNCIQIMTSVIKNLEPNTFQMLLNELVSSDIRNNKKEIEEYIRSKLGLRTTCSMHTHQYWIHRGWTVNESYVKSKNNNRKNFKSVYSREYWLEKTNPLTSKLYTLEEADFERNSRRPIKKEYWIKKGYSECDAQTLSKEVKFHNNTTGAQKSASSSIRKVTSKRCVEYYTARGYTEEDAKLLVSNGQKYFSKSICVDKHGEKEGFKIWQARQDKWQETLNSKSFEEIARINQLKLTKGISVSAAEREILKEIKKVDDNLPVISQLTLSTNNKKMYIYDISLNKKIIEYNGDFWHCNPLKYSADYVNPRTKLTASDKWNLDQEKINFAKEQGYEVLVIWENEFKENKEKVLKECIQFLTQ